MSLSLFEVEAAIRASERLSPSCTLVLAPCPQLNRERSPTAKSGMHCLWEGEATWRLARKQRQRPRRADVLPPVNSISRKSTHRRCSIQPSAIARCTSASCRCRRSGMVVDAWSALFGRRCRRRQRSHPSPASQPERRPPAPSSELHRARPCRFNFQPRSFPPRSQIAKTAPIMLRVSAQQMIQFRTRQLIIAGIFAARTSRLGAKYCTNGQAAGSGAHWSPSVASGGVFNAAVAIGRPSAAQGDWWLQGSHPGGCFREVSQRFHRINARTPAADLV